MSGRVHPGPPRFAVYVVSPPRSGINVQREGMDFGHQLRP
jgi:hypothetical protein